MLVNLGRSPEVGENLSKCKLSINNHLLKIWNVTRSNHLSVLKGIFIIPCEMQSATTYGLQFGIVGSTLVDSTS